MILLFPQQQGVSWPAELLLTSQEFGIGCVVSVYVHLLYAHDYWCNTHNHKGHSAPRYKLDFAKYTEYRKLFEMKFVNLNETWGWLFYYTCVFLLILSHFQGKPRSSIWTWCKVGSRSCTGPIRIEMDYSNSISPRLTLTHSWSRALLEKPPIVQLLENFPAFYGTRRFITAFT
jgi:hypothetical protein